MERRILGRAARGGWGGLWRAGIYLVVLTGVALAVTGCETNAQRSARLEKAAREQRLAHPTETQKGVTVTREDPRIKVLEAVILHSEGGTAAVVALKNTSGTPLRDAPIAVTATGVGGATLYTNNAPGLEPSLVSVPLLAPHAQTVWVDDQVQAASTPTAVKARVGSALTLSGTPPQLSVSGVHSVENPSGGTGEEGTVVNRSRVSQQQLVIYVVARRAGRVVAAGRAVLPEVAAGGNVSFQVFPIGNPAGAKLEVSAPPTTFG
jgi:hypothetical protein